MSSTITVILKQGTLLTHRNEVCTYTINIPIYISLTFAMAYVLCCRCTIVCSWNEYVKLLPGIPALLSNQRTHVRFHYHLTLRPTIKSFRFRIFQLSQAEIRNKHKRKEFQCWSGMQVALPSSPHTQLCNPSTRRTSSASRLGVYPTVRGSHQARQCTALCISSKFYHVSALRYANLHSSAPLRRLVRCGSVCAYKVQLIRLNT